MAKQKQRPVYEDQNSSAGNPVLKVILAVFFFCLAVLVVYLAFAPADQSSYLLALKNILRGLGGVVSPLLALMMVYFGVLQVFMLQGKPVRKFHLAANLLLILIGFSAVQLFCCRDLIENHMSINTYSNFVAQSYRQGTGGGAIGALLSYPLYMLFELWGGVIVLVAAALICLLINGKAQVFYRWAHNSAEKGQHHMEQRRNQRNVERMFDYNPDGFDADEYDGFDDRPRRRRVEAPRRREEPVHHREENVRRPQRRKAPSMHIADEEPIQHQGESIQTKRAPRKQKIYREVVDAEAAQDPVPQGSMDIPRSLRQLRKDVQLDQEDIPAKKKPRRKNGSFPQDIPDYLRVADEEEIIDEAQVPQEEPEADSFTPTNYQPHTDKKPRRVVEGVRALEVDDVVPAHDPDEDDDEPPFDIPHTTSKPLKKAMKRSDLIEDDLDEEDYNYPPIDLLQESEASRNTNAHRAHDEAKARKLISTLKSFSIDTELIGIAHGPAVTRFELQPAPGIRVNRITALADDIALALAAMSVRVEAPIPGKAAVGVEIPNDKIDMVRLRDVLQCPEARNHSSKIAVALGKDNSGRYIVTDIAKMPHVLIAGQTGSGKSVCINSIITSILYRATPDEVRMIMIDPKMVELSVYNDIPHLVAPVVTDPKKAASALDWAVAEMEGRYKRFHERNVRTIKGYNASLEKGEKPMPQMVIIIDELADLMMVAPGEVEASICRLAQLARAAGIHLVIATQRPSVNVITGVIKVNIPTRIAFSVASQVDSRTMIDHAGAEKLLGNGDMLFLPPGEAKTIRVQGAWVSDEEVNAIVSYIKDRNTATYDEDVIERIENSVRSDAEKEEVESAFDPKLAQAVEIVIEAGQASVSMLQRRMRVGYARAGRLIDEMERRGIVSMADGAKPRSVLITREQFAQMCQESGEDY